MTSGTDTLAAKVRKWFREPSTWLSLFSVVVSVGTSIYLTFWWGSVKIYMPPDIAIGLFNATYWQFAASTSLVNSAPPNNLKIIEDARLTVRLGNSSREQHCEWSGTSELIPTQEFQRLYKDVTRLDEIAKTKRDQFGPWQRKAPFSLHGGELRAKMLIFECSELESGSLRGPTQVRATIAVRVSGKWSRPSPERVYELPQELIDTARKDQSWEWGRALKQ